MRSQNDGNSQVVKPPHCGESILGEAETIVILLAVTLIVALTSRRLRLPYTLLLVLVGLVIGILPRCA